MSSYYEEEVPTDSRIDTVLWRRILAHARPYKRSLWGLALAGMIVAASMVLVRMSSTSLSNPFRF